MKKQYVKIPLSEEVFENGGATVVFTNKQTLPLDGAIDEALLGNYVIGQKNLIYQTFLGLMRSICDGIQRDGKARQIGDFITIYPVVKGPIDLERGYDPQKNRIVLRCNLLNEMLFDIDATNWTLEDVTPGKRAFTLESIKAGAKSGIIVVGEDIETNGRNIPSTELGEVIRGEWEVTGTEKRGEISAEKMASTITRVDIDGDALDELRSSEYYGKEIVFTFRGNFSNAKIKATLAAPVTQITTVAPASGDPGTTKSGVCMNIAGGELLMGDGDICKVRGVKSGESVEFTYTKADMTVNSNTMVTTALPKALAAHCFDADSKCYWSVKGSAEFETTYLDS